jgi:hypothetical protein
MFILALIILFSTFVLKFSEFRFAALRFYADTQPQGRRMRDPVKGGQAGSSSSYHGVTTDGEARWTAAYAYSASHSLERVTHDIGVAE